MRSKAKRAAAALGVGALLAAGLTLSACAAPGALLTIGGQEVGAREYTAVMEQQVAGVVRHFQTEYGAAYTAGFWQGSAGGGAPAEYLREATVKELVRCKAQEQLLREGGLWPFDSYEDFLAALEAENARRAGALEAGQVIYGPKAYGEREYYQYLLANGAQELKRAYLRQGRIDANETALKAFFARHPELVNQPYDTVELELLCYPYVSEDGAVAAGARQEAKEAAEAGLALLADTPMENLPQAQAAAAYSRRTFANATARTDSLLMPQVFGWAQGCEVGRQSGILEDNGAFWLARVTARQEAPQVQFEEVKDYISARYVDACYEELVEQAAAGAQVELKARQFPLPAQ